MNEIYKCEVCHQGRFREVCPTCSLRKFDAETQDITEKSSFDFMLGAETDTPETDAFLRGGAPPSFETLIEELFDHSRKLEKERDESRKIAKESCEMLASEGYRVNYPPMPWDNQTKSHE